MATTFEDIQESDEISLGIGARVGERIADARLSGKVDYPDEAVSFEQRFHRPPISQFSTYELKSLVPSEQIEASLLQVYVVVVVDVVEPDHMFAAVEKKASDMKADESRRTGDKHRILPLRVLPGSAGINGNKALRRFA